MFDKCSYGREASTLLAHNRGANYESAQQIPYTKSRANTFITGSPPSLRSVEDDKRGTLMCFYDVEDDVRKKVEDDFRQKMPGGARHSIFSRYGALFRHLELQGFLPLRAAQNGHIHALLDRAIQFYVGLALHVDRVNLAALHGE